MCYTYLLEIFTAMDDNKLNNILDLNSFIDTTDMNDQDEMDSNIMDDLSINSNYIEVDDLKIDVPDIYIKLNLCI